MLATVLCTSQFPLGVKIRGWGTRAVADTGWFGGGAMRCRFAMNPMLHRTILSKSITFAHLHLRGNKSELGLEEAWVIKLVKF